MDKVKIGIIGLGMGANHARSIVAGRVPRMELAAVCDPNPDRMAEFSDAKPFNTPGDLIQSGIDAVLIATPHYAHTPLGIEALDRGLHVLVEKPISVHKADCERLIAAHKNPRQVFAAMFNQRTDPFYIKIRDLVQSGELGEVRRVQWTITNWFRSHAYYSSSHWRATWSGEGGGVLLNQCPHTLDLLQWIFGMPTCVRGFCQLGRYHPIEVEDDVTAYLEFPNGANGVFITSTGEAPGSNRLEVAGERGRLVYENDRIDFQRNEVPMSEHSRSTTTQFSAPPVWNVSIPVAGHGGQHAAILKNFADAILDGAPLIAPAEEGIHSVELANAILFSSLQGATVELPMDSADYEKQLQDLAATSAGNDRKKAPSIRPAADDFANSYK